MITNKEGKLFIPGEGGGEVNINQLADINRFDKQQENSHEHVSVESRW